MLGAAFEEKKIRETTYGLDAIFSEENMTAFVKIYFMEFFVSEERRDSIKDELNFVDVEDDGGDFVEGIVFDEL